MGARGPKPTPTATLEARGSWRANTRTGEPKPQRGAPKCPTWLDTEAKKKWRELVPELERLGLVTIVDGDALSAYCQAWAEFMIATKTIKKDGRYLRMGKSGYLAPHPAVAQQRSAWQAIKMFAALFGLDPADRARMTADPEGDESDPKEKSKERFFRTVG